MMTTFFGAVACDVLLGLVCAAANFGKRKMNASATQNRFRVVERKAESGAFVIMK